MVEVATGKIIPSLFIQTGSSYISAVN